MSDFGDILNQIGQVVGTIGGNLISAINTAGAIQHGGLPQMLAQQSALRDDPAFRSQVGQPGFLSALQGGMAGLGFPQIGPDPNVQHAGYGNEGQLIGPTARTNIPPLSPYAQAEQAKAMRESQMGSMTPEMAAQEAARFGVGQPGGASRFVAQTPYGVATYGGTSSGLPQGDQPPDIRSHGGYDFENTPHGWKVVGKTGKGTEEPDLGVPVDTSGQPMEAPPPSAAPARAQGQAEPTADPVTVTGPITPQDYQAYHQALSRQVSQGQLTPDQANAQLFGLREAVTRPAAQTIASAQGGSPGPPSAAPSPAPPQAAPQAALAPQPAPGSPPGLQLPPGARMKNGQYFVPAGMSSKGEVSYTPYKDPGTAKITYPNMTLSAWAAGTDPVRGGAPATPDQVAAGKAWQKNQIEQKKAGAAATASQKPLGQATIQNLTTAASIKSLASRIRPMLDKADVKRWVGPIAGRAAWQLYSEIGYVPNEAIGSLITLGEVFKSEAAGRLARLAGSRSRVVWEELTVHPPHPWDDLPLLRQKLHDIEKITSEAGKLESELAKMPREQAARFMDKQLRDVPDRKAAPQSAPQGAPQPQGTPVEGVKGAIDLGPVGQSF